MQRRDLLLAFGLGFAGWDMQPVVAKVARIDFSSLVRGADLILVAKVEEVPKDDGVTVARAVPKRSLKGPAPDQFFFVAQPTWACDMSKAVPGETVLLFLKPAETQRVGFKGPAERQGVVTSRPLYTIAHAGRGRMVIETVQGQLGATLYAREIELPATFPRLKQVKSGSYVSWQTVPLATLEKIILREVESQKRTARK